MAECEHQRAARSLSARVRTRYAAAVSIRRVIEVAERSGIRSTTVYALVMYMLLHLAVLALTILVLSRLLPSVRIKSFGAALVVAIVFSVLNFFLGWFIRAMLFVPAMLTLGLLFLFVPFIVNLALLWLTDKLMGSFEITSLRGLLVSAAVITLVNGIFYAPYFHDAWQGYPDDVAHDAPGHTRWM